MNGTTSVTREYLETIYNLTVEGDPIVGARLAAKFGVSAANVAEVLRRLQRHGLIVMPGRGRGRAGEGIELTELGRHEAEQLLRQHRLAERFLADVLGMDWVQAHEEAHHLEKGLSPAIEERLMVLLGNPRTCPHGNPIPTGNIDPEAYLEQLSAVRLSAAQPGKPVKVVLISEVVEDESALLTYLGEMDIKPGARLTVEEHAGAEPLRAKVEPREEKRGTPRSRRAAGHSVELSADLAAKVWVRSE